MRQRLDDDRGFTLIELLTVILIIGILAVIVLGLWIGQSAKAQDAAAKSNARSMQGAVEACYTLVGTYDTCPDGDTGLSVGSGRGQVEFSPVGDTYVVLAHSQSGNDFQVERIVGGVVNHTCTTAGTPKGGCNAGSW